MAKPWDGVKTPDREYLIGEAVDIMYKAVTQRMAKGKIELTAEELLNNMVKVVLVRLKRDSK
jgi:hypothetical protein